METTKITMFMIFMLMYFYVIRWLCYVVEIFFTKHLAAILSNQISSLLVFDSKWTSSIFLMLLYSFRLRFLLFWTLAYQAPDGEWDFILYSSTIMKIWDLYTFSKSIKSFIFSALIIMYYNRNIMNLSWRSNTSSINNKRIRKGIFSLA